MTSTPALVSHVGSREHVNRVEIDAPEELDVADRAEFYWRPRWRWSRQRI